MKRSIGVFCVFLQVDFAKMEQNEDFGATPRESVAKLANFEKKSDRRANFERR